MSIKRKTRQNGFVIIVVLCIVMMLAVMLFGFNSESRMNLRVVENSMRSEQALNCARAGLNITIAAIRNTVDESTSEPLQKLLSEKNTFDLFVGTCSITMVDESSKLNINLLKNKHGKLDRARIDQLLRLIDVINKDIPDDLAISHGLVPSIIDWVDNDDQVTYLPFIKSKNIGAESNYYNRLKMPYACKDRQFDTIQELLLVKGMTAQTYTAIRDYITVYGDGKININCASRPVIESLSEKMDSALARLIIEQRKYQPFRSVTQLRNVPGMTDEIYYDINKSITVDNQSQYYHVTSCGTVDDSDCTIIAVIRENTKTKNIEVVVYEEC